MAPSRSRRLLYGLITAALIGCVTEGVLRLVVPEQSLLLSWEKQDGLLLYRSRSYVGGPVDPSERVRWRRGELGLKPDAQSIRHDGPHPWSVRTNSEGLREDAEVASIQRAERQYLALGDSWVFGVSAGQGRTIADHLERALPGRLGVESVSVVNGGIPGANAFHMLRRWNYLRDRIPMDGLILGLPHNAPDADVPAARRAWYASTSGAPYFRSFIYLAIRRLILPLSRPRYPDLLATDSADHNEMTLADLKTIVRDAQERKIPTWLLIWPNDMVAAQGPGTELSQWVQPLASDLAGYGGHALTERSCWGFEDTWHPSEAGYGAIAAVAVDVVADGLASTTLATMPTCRSVPGAGPGK